MTQRGQGTYRRILWLHVLLGLTLVGSGIPAMIWGGYIPLYEAFQTRNWEKADCNVLYSDYKVSTVESYFDDDGGRLMQQTEYKLNIDYEYEWDELFYTSNRYNLKDFVFTSEDTMKRIVGRFPAGEKVVCYVNSRTPNQAVLTMIKFQWVTLVIIFMVGLWTIGGIALILSGLNNHERSSY